MLPLRGVPWSADPADRLATRDLWPRRTLSWTTRSATLTGASVVAWPRNDDEVVTTLNWAKTEGLAVVPFGGGSGVCGATESDRPTVALDLKRMDHIGDVQEGVVEVGAGVLGSHLEAVLAARGFTCGHSPSSIACSTVGGWAATRSAGQFSSRYGVFDDLLVGVKGVGPHGSFGAGIWRDGSPDLLPQHSGAEGTLGVITRVALRVFPLSQARWLRGYAFPSVEVAWEAMCAILQAELRPMALRLYDAVDSRLGGRTKARKPGHRGGPPPTHGALRRAWDDSPGLQGLAASIPLAVPSLVNALATSLGREVLLIVGFEGTADEVASAAAAAGAMLRGGRDLGAEPGEHWYGHRHAVSYKLAPVFVAGLFADTMEVAASWSRLPELHAAVRAALGRHCGVMAHFSHAYAEGCSIYFSFVGRGKLAVYDAVWRDALDAARAAGGTVAHHHGMGRLKADAVRAELGPAMRIWREARLRADPDGLLVPWVGLQDGGSHHVRAREGGPLFVLDERSRLAWIDPQANTELTVAALAARGWRPRHVWSGPFAAAVARWAEERTQPEAHGRVPFFGVEATFSDGPSVALGVAPRSAAGPDLRWALFERPDVTVSAVEIPLLPGAA